MNESACAIPQHLADLRPVLNDGSYVYACVPVTTDLTALEPLATFREAEGITIIVAEALAKRARITILYRAAWITLQAHTDLQAVGYTAVFAAALARAGIGCNVMAAAHHDHLFVPLEAGQRALEALRALQSMPPQT